MLCWREMVKRPHPTDDTGPPILNHRAKLIIGTIVFALGVLAGAAIAAWVIPPS
jgi:hypothetical protein